LAFGDLSTNAAMRIGHQLRRPAKEVAVFLVERINSRLKYSQLDSFVDRVEIKGPGFINFHLKNTSLYYVLDEIKALKNNYAKNNLGAGKKIQIEFVSANPTGPLTVAHGRQAVFGDSLASILEFSGFKVVREYYVNDEGRQIDILGQSIRARYLELVGEELTFPEDGYKGTYIRTLASEIKKKFGKRKRKNPVSYFSKYGYSALLKEIRKDLDEFGVKFNVWYSQKRLREKGITKKALNILQKKNFLYKKEGAVWFKSSQFGDEKDRVVVKSDGAHTYIAPDIGYHMDKYKRRFERVINIWGPDHHGYIPRIKAAVEALGIDPKRLDCLIAQLVTLYKGKEIIPISTREGQFITLKDVVKEVGKDAARFFFLMRRRDSLLNFDLELAKKHSLDNPVYYIQYAHARICSITEFHKSGSKSKPQKAISADKTLLKTNEEFRILKTLREFPLVIKICAKGLEPYPLIPYLQDLAASFHSFYNKHRVVTDNLALTQARLELINCARIILATGLKLLGISTPTKM